MGRPHVCDRGLAGLVLQLLKGWSTDVDRQGFGPGFQMAGAFSLQAEHDLSHAVYLLLSGSILDLLRRSGRCEGIRGTGPAGTCPCRLKRASPAQRPDGKPPARP